MEKLQQAIKEFIAKRNWQQFHTPKNLAMALTVEAAELQEIFQWLTPEESSMPDEATLRRAEEEIGDVLIYLTTLADALGLDPMRAAKKKLQLNGIKYPEDDQNGPVPPPARISPR